MAGAESVARARPVWLPANPWIWMIVGLLVGALALAWVRLFQLEATWFRVLLVALGSIAAGSAIALRLRSTQPAYLEALPQPRRRQALALLLAAVAAPALLALGLLVGALTERDIPWETGDVIWLNVLVVPIAGVITFLCYGSYKTGKPLSATVESAALLLLAAVCAFLCSWALYVDNVHVKDWDTMRWVLAALAGVALVAAPVALLPRTGRRIVISVLILIHFGGIMTAVMSAPPTPWLFRQIWARLYRPYLQFMYLNNSYHFYAPEPGPSSFLWFRVEYLDDKKVKSWHWIESPKMKADGTADHPLGLLFQRRIAMNDQVQFTDGNLPSEPAYFWRQVHSDRAVEEMLGKIIVQRPQIKIPFHPSIRPEVNQYKAPNQYSKKLIESFAHHIFKQPIAGQPNAKVLNVKVYRVVHSIPTPEMITAHIEPTHPILYQPFYMGQHGIDPKDGKFKVLDEPTYDAAGSLLSGDPLLYWLVPILPDDQDLLKLNKTIVRGYVYRHAGDQKWVWYPGDLAPREEK